MKRNLIIAFFLVLATAAGFIYFSNNDTLFSKETSLYKAVPIDAPVFVELSALKTVPVDNPIVENLLAMETDVLFLKKVAFMDSLIQNNKNLQKSLRNESMIIAFDFVGDKGIFPLIIAKAANSSKQKDFEKFLSVLYSGHDYAFTETAYSNHKITSVTSSKSKKALYFCFTDGLLIASPKVLLVEQCIRQLNEQSVADDQFFSKVNKTVSAQSNISWYINHKTFPDLVAHWLNNRSSIKTNEFGEKIRSSFKNNFQGFRNFAAWTELDVKFNNNGLVLNGISTSTDSLNHFLSVFDGQEPVRFQADRMLPKNTSFFTSYSFSDKSLFFKNLENYFSHTNSFYKRENRIKKMEKGFRIDFKNTFQNFVKNELIVATTSIPTETEKKTTLFIIRLDNKSEAENQFIKLLTTWSARKKIDFNSLKQHVDIDAKTSVDIYKFPYPSFPGIWLGKPFNTASARFAAFYNNSLVFSNTEKGLRNYLYNMVLGATLDDDSNYSEYKSEMAGKANINSYINVTRVFSLNKDIFNTELAKGFENLKENIRKFKAVNWQVICEKGVSFNSVSISFNPSIAEEAQTTWQCSVGSEIEIKPQIVVNHSNKATREIIFQDAENTLHLVSNSGRILWNYSVGSRVLGEIHQIDYFRNGRLQYLFNTKEMLYLIDRNGNNVAHFPVKFSSPSTNGVAVFDYDNNRKYRYFVALKNGKVVAFSNEGKVLTGWKFGKTNSPVTTPVQHFRVNNKDYIVFKDRSKIYIQNRRGETRVKTEAKFENSKNPLILNLNGTPKIIATDKTGKVFYLYFNGKFSEKRTAKFSENHFFTVADLNGNGVPDFIFVDGNVLKVMDENGKKLFSHKFKTAIHHRPNIYSFSSKLKKIGITESESNRIYLFNPTGKLHEGFPLQGNSEFSIGKLAKNSGQLNLIVGSSGGDLYNYTLN